MGAVNVRRRDMGSPKPAHNPTPQTSGEDDSGIPSQIGLLDGLFGICETIW